MCVVMDHYIAESGSRSGIDYEDAYVFILGLNLNDFFVD